MSAPANIARGGIGGALMVAIPGGLVVGGGAVATRLYVAGRTGVVYLDSPAFRWRQALAVLRVFGPKAAVDLRYMRAMQSIAHNEFDPRKPIGGQLGDIDLPGGPSVGPEQVYRATAIELGLWSPPDDAPPEEVRELYGENARHPLRMLVWGAAVFRSKLAAADGDFADAIRRYNGSGSKAEAYEAKALAFASGDWGSHVFDPGHAPGGEA